jgi:basic amino acid/polyamine antiporter, APA family
MNRGISLRSQLFRTKPVAALVTETAGDPKHGHLARSIGLFQLTMLGVGATSAQAFSSR